MIVLAVSGYKIAHSHHFVQALFRKIAAALPGMEALSSHKDDLVDVNLKPTSNPQTEGKAGGCAC